MKSQLGINSPLPACAKYCFFRLLGDSKDVARRLNTIVDDNVVIGLGLSLLKHLGLMVPGMKSAPDFSWQGLDIPQTPSALCVWVRGSDAGIVALRTRKIVQQLAGIFELVDDLDGFLHREGRDVTGYEDGTENPSGEAAHKSAFVPAGAFAESSFMAVQCWLHDMEAFEALPLAARNHIIGRDLESNEELEDAPARAHVKRTEQESFSPPQFVLRKSMAWQGRAKMGLMFVAFGASFDAFEAQMYRMTGSVDGIRDALFDFSRPLTSAYYWCPAVDDNQLVLDGKIK
ncbi:Dyp-type peroxidase [Simiduia curdlanivorans]|uniref:Dyp-type peroxidase n=1 Tax=Simiduia curdlanivorans TaxID=1492769 RepID=A0ABV8V9L3_9GAMM|nr:Dyp-type peroxidase [Simiduia curdlanivorans]MDN3639757.1 Dyp-type peroxidase [Simiduia curdlanivorans]